MSSNSDSQNISKSPSVMTDSDINSDNDTSNSIELIDSPVVDISKELRSKSHHDCSTSGRPDSESPLRASPLGALVNLGQALGVLVYSQYVDSPSIPQNCSPITVLLPLNR